MAAGAWKRPPSNPFTDGEQTDAAARAEAVGEALVRSGILAGRASQRGHVSGCLDEGPDVPHRPVVRQRGTRTAVSRHEEEFTWN
jgi:hypothetical protein